MRPRHVLLATLIAAIWGFNFVPIRVGLDDFPPLLFAALRFTAAALPAVLVVRRPPVPARWLLLIGVPLGVGQFGLMFISMRLGMPAGLASVVLQISAIFTALFAGALLRERLTPRQLAGMAVAFAGVALLGVAQSGGRAGPAVAFLLCVGAAASWGLANVGMRRMNQDADGPVDAFGFMVWMSLVPPVPLFALSLLFEGPDEIAGAFRHATFGGYASLAYIAYLSTLVGFGLWGWLMRRYEASTVAMYSLLVPPFGLASAAAFLGEGVGPVRLAGAALIVSGVAIGSLRRRAARPGSAPPPAPPSVPPPAQAAPAQTR
ncbi:EamA family transporter [Actinomadura yumaensis]|uniref:EamA family transporter n=1 Tax=Actinomadura yumaensis TaxID=111807 RepID=A0ABW2CDP0_9ACTN